MGDEVPEHHMRLTLLMWWLLVLVVVQADLPVHCIGDDVFGEWVLHLGPSGYTNSELCGHSRPDNPKENWAVKQRTFRIVRDYKVTLRSNNTAVDENGNEGFWTMIYDEGFEIQIAQRSYFAFSKFVPRPHAFNMYPAGGDENSAENFLSICTETLDGWYHFNNGSDWGCYYATKTPVAKGNEGTDAVVNAMQMLGPSGSVDFIEVSSQDEDDSAFQSRFSTHSRKRVMEINNQPNIHWKAKSHSEFESMSFLELQGLLGVRAHKHIQVSAVPDNREHHIKYEGLPDAFDWRNIDGVNYVPTPRKQGSCGSCYAIAATQMLEARIRIKTKNQVQVQLSPQSILSCSAYSQSCDGGFPYLVGKYAYDFGILEEQCLPYQPKRAECSWQCRRPTTWYATNYHYVGGAYGKCSEVAMMQEVFRNGPVIVGFNAPQDLFWYSEGIYHESKDEVGFLELGRQHAFFEKTNHAVLAVGWGVDSASGKKYWIVQNTWGDDWGDGGYFRIERGVDMCAFEAMSVAFDPIIPENVTQLKTNSSQKVPPLTAIIPEPVLAHRVQIDGHAQVVGGETTGFVVPGNTVDSEDDDPPPQPLTVKQMMSNGLQVNEGSKNIHSATDEEKLALRRQQFHDPQQEEHSHTHTHHTHAHVHHHHK